jgi:hypothetical protein
MMFAASWEGNTDSASSYIDVAESVGYTIESTGFRKGAGDGPVSGPHSSSGREGHTSISITRPRGDNEMRIGSLTSGPALERGIAYFRAARAIVEPCA